MSAQALSVFLSLRIVLERCGKNEHMGGLAGVGSFKPGYSAPLLRCFILRALLREEKRGSGDALIKAVTVSGRGARKSYSDEHYVSVSAQALCGRDPDRRHAHSSPATLAV